MPTYDYDCADCGPFDALRSMSARNDPAPCPSCGKLAQRVLIAAPQLALMNGDSRVAIATNERARHEPASSRDYARLRHRAGCSCCGPGKSRTTVTAANGNKVFPNRRPWMISH